MNNEKVTNAAALFVLLACSVFGLIVGSVNTGEIRSFSDAVIGFVSDARTRTILVLILTDLVTGVAAAMRSGIFDVQKIGTFYRTNVVPFVLGYALVWAFAFFGLDSSVPGGVSQAIAAIGFGVIVTALTGSIFDNVQRLRAGTVAPRTDEMLNEPIDNPRG